MLSYLCYILVLTCDVLCRFLHSASMSLAETLISYMSQGEEVCHLKYLDLVTTILNDKKVRISRNHFSVTNQNLSHISSSFVGLGLNPTQKPQSHLFGNFNQRSWIRIPLKNSPILLQCARLKEKHI